jgi:hypothetical protein
MSFNFLKALLWCFGVAIEDLRVKTQIWSGWAAMVLVCHVLPGGIILEVSSMLRWLQVGWQIGPVVFRMVLSLALELLFVLSYVLLRFCPVKHVLSSVNSLVMAQRFR